MNFYKFFRIPTFIWVIYENLNSKGFFYIRLGSRDFYREFIIQIILLLEHELFIGFFPTVLYGLGNFLAFILRIIHLFEVFKKKINLQTIIAKYEFIVYIIRS